MDWKVFWAVVAALVLVLGWKLWLSLIVIIISLALQLGKFLLIDWWMGLLGHGAESLGAARYAYERPGWKWGTEVWAHENRFHSYHVKMRNKYGPDWYKPVRLGGIYTDEDKLLPTTELKARAEAHRMALQGK